VTRVRRLIWTRADDGPTAQIQRPYRTFDYQKLKRKIRSSQSRGSARSSLNNPAQGILNIFQKHERIVIHEVKTCPQDDLPLIYAYLVEPAFRCGCTLVLRADCSLEELRLARAFADGEWRYPWSQERLLYLLDKGKQPQEVPWNEPVAPWRQIWSKVCGWVDRQDQKRGLDPQQMAAVNAGDGVVQIIAPAGSGKTTVLIQRVKELQRRGTPPERILCMSFNRDAKVEIGERLAKAGLQGAVVRSFHGMGLAILKEEGRLRQEIGSLPDACLYGLADRVMAELGPDPVHTKPSLKAMQNTISEYKLARMISPEVAVAGAQGDDVVGARIYQLYEEELARRRWLDFDDLVARSVGLLQGDPEVRQRWQNRFERVLVDEYQDIEPSQALLVGILAAPQDSLFCVGDEDQCIYAWRRATVQRIIELDQMYPGLERHALIHNYRCGRRITTASRKLIQHNKVRFRKPLVAGAQNSGNIAAASCTTRTEAAQLVAHLVSDAQGEEVVVLARTSRLLDEVGQNLRAESSIELSTMHGAKGREWDRVIIYGVDEGQTPHAAALAEGETEAERRLFYVGLTRAKQRLEIICTAGQESRFLKEAGIRVRAWEGEKS